MGGVKDSLAHGKAIRACVEELKQRKAEQKALLPPPMMPFQGFFEGPGLQIPLPGPCRAMC